MEQESELQRLEKFVEKILARFTALKAEKEQLDQDLLERDMLIEELRDTIASKVTERNEISERVNKIVDQIEQWETDLDGEAVASAGQTSENNDIDEEDSLAEEEESPRASNDEEKHVQHGLFSMSGSRK